MSTRMMVLGLLSRHPMAGYEIQQVLQMGHTDRWAGILSGSIYHSIKKMESEGLLKVESVERTGNRLKTIYGITPTGAEELKRMVKEALSIPEVSLPTSLYTALTFMDVVDRSTVRDALANQISALEEAISQIVAGQSQKATRVPSHARSVFNDMLRHYNEHLAFLKSLVQEI